MRLEPIPGESVRSLARRALKMAKKEEDCVHFVFEGIEFEVDPCESIPQVVTMINESIMGHHANGGYDRDYDDE